MQIDHKKLGSIEDPFCKQNDIRPISKRVCRNSCQYCVYDKKLKRKNCQRGYW